MTNVTVVLEYRETGQQQPVELVDGTVLGWTRREAGERYYNYKLSLEDFNRLAPKIFTARTVPGFEPIPQVRLTEVADVAPQPTVVAQPPATPPPTEVQETTSLTVDAIKAALAARTRQVSDLAKEFSATPEAIRAFVKCYANEFHESEKGGWLKLGPAPVASPLAA